MPTLPFQASLSSSFFVASSLIRDAVTKIGIDPFAASLRFQNFVEHWCNAHCRFPKLILDRTPSASTRAIYGIGHVFCSDHANGTKVIFWYQPTLICSRGKKGSRDEDLRLSKVRRQKMRRKCKWKLDMLFIEFSFGSGFFFYKPACFIIASKLMAPVIGISLSLMALIIWWSCNAKEHERGERSSTFPAVWAPIFLPLLAAISASAKENCHDLLGETQRAPSPREGLFLSKKLNLQAW